MLDKSIYGNESEFGTALKNLHKLNVKKVDSGSHQKYSEIFLEKKTPDGRKPAEEKDSASFEEIASADWEYGDEDALECDIPISYNMAKLVSNEKKFFNSIRVNNAL